MKKAATERKFRPLKIILEMVLIVSVVVVALNHIYPDAYDCLRYHVRLKKVNEKVFRELVARQLNKESNELTSQDYNKIYSLNLWDPNIINLKPLKKFKNLQVLHFDKRSYIPLVSNIKPLGKLKNLQTLSIRNAKISDIKPLAKLKNLQTLYLINLRNPYIEDPPEWLRILRSFFKLPYRDGPQLFDINPISKLTNLEKLSIKLTRVENIDVLTKLKKLKHLELDETSAEDIAPLAGFTNLEYLGLSNVNVTNIKPLEGLTNLRELSLEWARISDLESIKQLTNLQRLTLNSCFKITDEQVEDLQKALPKLEIIFIEW